MQTSGVFFTIVSGAILTLSVFAEPRRWTASPAAPVADTPLQRAGISAYSFQRGTTSYFKNCGGCHGLHGESVPENIPTLRGFVGYFTKFQEGRAYLVQVPGVANSPIRDNEELADVLNFVVMEFGSNSMAPDFQPFTAAEVAELRKDPIISNLRAYRTRLVSKILRDEGLPPSADRYSAGPGHN